MQVPVHGSLSELLRPSSGRHHLQIVLCIPSGIGPPPFEHPLPAWPTDHANHERPQRRFNAIDTPCEPVKLAARHQQPSSCPKRADGAGHGCHHGEGFDHTPSVTPNLRPRYGARPQGRVRPLAPRRRRSPARLYGNADATDGRTAPHAWRSSGFRSRSRGRLVLRHSAMTTSLGTNDDDEDPFPWRPQENKEPQDPFAVGLKTSC